MSSLSYVENHTQECWQHAVSLAGQKRLQFASYTPFIDGVRAPVDFEADLARPMPLLAEEGR